MRYRVLPYKRGSQSAKALAEALGGRVLRLEASTYVPRLGDVVINWGQSDKLLAPNTPLINSPENITNASNKLVFFQRMQYAAPNFVPNFWTNPGSIPDEAFPIVCRTVLNGHSGIGIVISDTREELVPASLYVKYVKKEQEYRIHLGVRGVVISMQRKARSRDVPDGQVNWKIRNHKNGFVFVRNDVSPPDRVLDAAKRAMLVSGLDFGAVDVIDDVRNKRAYVLEINTAPGLAGTTVEDYARYFQEA